LDFYLSELLITFSYTPQTLNTAMQIKLHIRYLYKFQNLYQTDTDTDMNIG
jgi:hypothetical protein